MFEIQWETIVTNINWTFVVNLVQFFLLVLILNRMIYRPLAAFIDGRQARMKAQLHEAEQQRAAAETLRRERESELRQANRQARRALQAARQQGDELRRALRVEAEGQANQIIADARTKAEKELKPVREALLGQIDRLAETLVAKAMGKR